MTATAIAHAVRLNRAVARGIHAIFLRLPGIALWTMRSKAVLGLWLAVRPAAVADKAMAHMAPHQLGVETRVHARYWADAGAAQTGRLSRLSFQPPPRDCRQGPLIAALTAGVFDPT